MQNAPPIQATPVTIQNLDIPFFQLVWLLIKVALAAIPAGIILSVVFAIVGGLMFAALAVLGAAL